MSNAVTAYYSIKTGNRVTEKYGRRNPNLVKSFVFVEGTVAVEFLDRGHTIPTKLNKAQAADARRKVEVAKAEADKAAKAAKKAARKVSPKKTAKKTVKKVAKKAAKKTAKKAAKKATKKAVIPASQSGLVN